MYHVNAFLHNLLIIPFSHHALLHTHNPPLLICSPPFSNNNSVSIKHCFHTPVFASSPKTSQNNVDSQSWSSNTLINHLIVNEWEWNNTPKKHPKHSHLYLQTTLFTPSCPQTPLNTLTCRKPEKYTHKLVWRKEPLCLCFQSQIPGILKHKFTYTESMIKGRGPSLGKYRDEKHLQIKSCTNILTFSYHVISLLNLPETIFCNIAYPVTLIHLW